MTTYSISLDDVDLALLPLRSRNNDFLKREHYQFQVIKQPVLEPPSDITYTCHICAIEVPAAFASEHAASAKHGANARIASVASQRMRQLVFAPPTPLAPRTSARFCAHCTTVVDDDHDKTKEHRVAVMHDNLLCELMKAYVGDDDDGQNSSRNQIFVKNQDKTPISGKNDVEETNKSNDAVVKETIDKQEPPIENKADIIVTKVQQTIPNIETNDKVSEKHNRIEEVRKLEVTEYNLSSNKSENNPANSMLPTTSRWVKTLPQTKDVTENGIIQSQPKTDGKDGKEIVQKTKLVKEPYEKELRKFMDTNNQFQIKEIYQRIHIKVNNDTVNVYCDHFHSFHRIYKNGNIECIVCNTTFNEKDSEAHKYSLNHMSGVVKIGSDGEYVREINETHSHCILCNQKINNINVANHKQSQHHTLRKTNNVRSDVKTKEATKISNNENEPIHNDKVTTGDVNKDPYVEVSGGLWCSVCDCLVPKDVRNREDHVEGVRHLNNLKTKEADKRNNENNSPNVAVDVKYIRRSFRTIAVSSL